MPTPGNDGLRRCLVTRVSQPKDQLVRFVIDPEGRVRSDVAARLPGRGMWLSARREVIDKAVRRNVFAKVAGRGAALPGLADEIEAQLAARVLDGLGLARRAGQLVSGFEKVRRAIVEKTVGVLFEAADGAYDGERKLRALAPDLLCVKSFDRREMGAAVGRDEVVHAAVLAGSLARRIRCDAERLDGFRPSTLERVWSPGHLPGGETHTATGTR